MGRVKTLFSYLLIGLGLMALGGAAAFVGQRLIDRGAVIDPLPDVPDVPKSVPAGVVFVEDPGKAGQTRGLFLADERVQAFFTNSHLEHAVYSVHATDADDRPIGGAAGEYIRRATAAGLPYQFILSAEGAVLKEGPLDLADPEAFLAQFDGHKGPRAMGCKNEPPKMKWVEFASAEAPTTQLIPRDQWKPVDLEAYAGPVYDQDGRGECNACMGCNLIEISRSIGGMGYVHLSAGDLYSRINGGRDNGSTLEDGMAELLRNGVATAKAVPYVWNGRRYETAAVKAERRLYKAKEVFLCPSFAHVASALQQGFPTGIGLQWRDNFKPDKDGWLPSVGRGGAGGHAVAAVGLAKRTLPNGKTEWGVKIRNSWSVSWGSGGNAVVPESLFDGWIGGFYAVGATVRTPEPFPPAVLPKRSKLSLPAAETMALAP